MRLKFIKNSSQKRKNKKITKFQQKIKTVVIATGRRRIQTSIKPGFNLDLRIFDRIKPRASRQLDRILGVPKRTRETYPSSITKRELNFRLRKRKK